LTQLRRSQPLSKADEERFFQSRFVSRNDYEQYASHLQEQEKRDQRDAEARETARQARIENDPVHWKRMYEIMVGRENERQRTRKMWLGGLMICGVFFAIMSILRLFGIT
jgi:hypothetical protein